MVRNTILLAIVFCCKISFGQHLVSKSDSLWCENLNELLMCASLDIVSEKVGVKNDTSVNIPKFKPKIYLTSLKNESVLKLHDKILYEGVFYSTAKNDAQLKKQYQSVFEKFHSCLDMWSIDSFENQNKELLFYKDKMLTNSEDETTVKFRVLKDKLYKLIVTIY